MEGPPKWLEELHKEAITNQSKITEPETWIKSMSDDYEEKKEGDFDKKVMKQQSSVSGEVLETTEVSISRSTSNSSEQQPALFKITPPSRNESFDKYDLNCKFPDVSPRITSSTRRSSIFSGSFSANIKVNSSEKDATYRSIASNVEQERISYFSPPSVTLPILLPFDPSTYERRSEESTITISEKGIIQSLKSLSALQSDILSVSPKQYQEILMQTLECAINFVLTNSQQILFFCGYELVDPNEDDFNDLNTDNDNDNGSDNGDDDGEENLNYNNEPLRLYHCDLLSTCVLNYLHVEDIAIKTILLFNLVLQEEVGLKACDPNLRQHEKTKMMATKSKTKTTKKGENSNDNPSMKLWRHTNSHPCEIIQKVLALHGQSNQFILHSTLVAICNLSKINGCCKYFTDNCLTIIQMMESYLSSETQIKLTEFSCIIFCKFVCCSAFDELRNQTIWINAKVYNLFDNMLCRHSNNPSVIEWICKSVYCLVQGPITPNQESLIFTTFCQTLLATTLPIRDDFPRDVTLWACRLIGLISFQCQLTRTLLGESGACPLLCRLLEEYGYAEPDVVECICWALANLSSQNLINRNILLELGLDDLLLSFLRLYNHSFPVVREILITIHNLFDHQEEWYEQIEEITSIEKDIPINEDKKINSPKMIKMCQIILQSIDELERKRRSYWKTFGLDVQLVLPWLWYGISGISFHQYGRSILIDCEIQKCLISTLRYSTNDFTLRIVYLTLHNFILDLPTHYLDLFTQVSIHLSNSIHRIIAYPDAVSVGCELISKLSMTPSLSTTLGNYKVCQILMKILKRHQMDKRIVEIVFFAIKNLSNNNQIENIKKFESNNACQLIPMTMILHHCDTFPIALWGCEILHFLSYSKQSMKKLYNSNVSQCILLSFNSHISILPILQEVCDLLSHFCSQMTIPSFIHSLISAGVCEMLTNILIICLDETNASPSSPSSSNSDMSLTTSCTLSCLQCINILVNQNQSNCVEIFSRMGCHVLLFNNIKRFMNVYSHTVICFHILKTLLEGNGPFLRKQLMKNDIVDPLIKSYGSDLLLKREDITSLVEENIISASECICLFLLNSSQNKSELFIIRDIFHQFVNHQIIFTLDQLISIHLKLDIGERAVVCIVKVIVSLLECYDLFYPVHSYQPVLNLQTQVYVTLMEPDTPSPDLTTTRTNHNSLIEMSLIQQLNESNVMKKLIELLSIYLNEDFEIIEWVIRSLILYVKHDIQSQNVLDSLGLCELSMKLLTLPNLPSSILPLCFALINQMTLFNLKLKFKYLSLSCERVIVQYLQHYFQNEDLVCIGISALASLATGHDMLNTPIYHPISIICEQHLESKKMCMAVCSILCSVTHQTRESAFASTSFTTSFLSFKSHISPLLHLSQSLVNYSGKFLSSSEICRSVLISLLNIILLHSQEMNNDDEQQSQSFPNELRYLLIETNLLKNVGYVIVRHLGLEDICYLTVVLIRLVTTFLDLTELSHDFVHWRHFMIDRNDQLSAQILSKCHGTGMNNFVYTILEAYPSHREIAFHSVTSLYQLSFHKHIKSYLANPTVLSKIISLFHSDCVNENLVISMLQLTSRLCENDHKSSRYLIDSGICELLVWSLETYMASPILAKYMCRCVHLLTAADSTAQGMFHSCNSWNAISTCLESYSNHPAISFECSNAIYSLCLDHQQNIKKFATSKVCISLVTILTEHELNEQICLADFQALSLLCPTYCHTLTQLNQISDLTKFLTSLRTQIPNIASRFSKNDRIILWSNRVLNSVHADPSSPDYQLNPEPPQRPEQETSRMIISNLETYFITHPAIVLESLISIGHSLAIDSNQFHEINLCHKMKETLVRYGDNIPIVIACCKVISLLTTSKHISDLTTTKLSQTLLEILSRRYQKNTAVMEWGCQAIRNISLDERNKDYLITTCSGCEVVVGALQIGTGSGDAIVAIVLQKPIGNTHLSLVACEALCSLASSSSNLNSNSHSNSHSNPSRKENGNADRTHSYQERLGSCGACEALVRVIQKYSESAEIAAAVCKGFVFLADNCPTNRLKLTNIGACKIILSVLETHYSYQPAANWACRAVEIMSCPINGTIPETKFGVGICPAVLQAMQCHQGVIEVASSGSSALSSLTYYPHFLLPLLQHHVIEILLFSIQLCVFDELTIISSCSAICRLMNPNTYNIFIKLDCHAIFLCLLFKYYSHPITTYPIWWNIYKLSFCSTDCCKEFLNEGILEIYFKVLMFLFEMIDQDDMKEVTEEEPTGEEGKGEEGERGGGGVELVDEEEWLSNLTLMHDIWMIFYDKQFLIVQQTLADNHQQHQQDLLHFSQRLLQRQERRALATKGNQLEEQIQILVKSLLKVIPNEMKEGDHQKEVEMEANEGENGEINHQKDNEKETKTVTETDIPEEVNEVLEPEEYEDEVKENNQEIKDEQQEDPEEEEEEEEKDEKGNEERQAQQNEEEGGGEEGAVGGVGKGGGGEGGEEGRRSNC